MTAPKWVRPDHPPTPHTTTRHNGRNWTAWALARQAITDARNGTLARHVRAYLDALDEWMGVPRPALGRYLTEPDEERNAA